MSRRSIAIGLLSTVLAACGGGAAGTVAPGTQGTATTAPPTAAPTAAAVLTNPPTTPIPGCLPQCWFGHLTRPGAISGEFTTTYFFGGQMTVTVPDGWFGYEDSTGELAIGQPNDENARMEFWLDVYAAGDQSGAPDESVERTGDAVLAWFVDKPIIDVIERKPLTLDGIPAESIEYKRNDEAATEVSDCPEELRPCALEFGYPEWDGAFAEGGPFHSKLVVANATWGGQAHTIYVMFWAIDPYYEDLLEEADAVIASVQLPEGVEAAK